LKKLLKRLIVLAVLATILPSAASAFCFEEAGAQYSVDPDTLRSMAIRESRLDPAAVNVNVNGSVDVGLMQINSSWKKRLGVKLWEHVKEPCTNVKVGAYILSLAIEETGDLWTGVGRYHSRNKEKAERYARKIFEIYERIRDDSPEALALPASLSVGRSLRKAFSSF
jgi:soluble lytic murein transglycosylase-like protein